MFTNGLYNNYSTENMDISLHSGIPKKYYNLKNKNFSDWEIPPWELYIFQDRKLGEGTFSNVYLAKWRETFVVAKVIKEEILEFKKTLFLREIDIMSKLHHPNIVQFLGFIDDPFIIIMEYIPNKNLQDSLPLLNKKNKIVIMNDILKGLTYLHNRRPYSLIHRDIKPTNILLTNSKVAKITDFGLSKFYNLTQSNSNNNLCEFYDQEMTGNVGTERYMAPEIRKEKEYNNKIDIFSCGVLFYELFENKKYVPMTENKWYRTPRKIRDFIKNHMLNENPENRLDAHTLLKILNNTI